MKGGRKRKRERVGRSREGGREGNESWHVHLVFVLNAYMLIKHTGQGGKCWWWRSRRALAPKRRHATAR